MRWDFFIELFVHVRGFQRNEIVFVEKILDFMNEVCGSVVTQENGILGEKWNL